MNLSLEVATATLDKISSVWNELEKEVASLCSSKIRSVNLAREVGLHLRGLCQHEQLRLSLFENMSAGLPSNMSFFAAQRCVAVSHALKQPATSITEANAAEYQTLLALGMVETARMLEPRNASSGTPFTVVFHALSGLRVTLNKQLSELDDWDDEMRLRVLESVSEFESTLAVIKSKLAREKATT